MSDFDKEKERERLREKYEREQEKREATERMSELLLQGATMTNAHCSECGDPVFRYDGQEFCATCEKPIDRDADATGEDEGRDDGQGQVEVAAPSDDARVAFGGDSSADSDGTADGTDSDAQNRPRERIPDEQRREDRDAGETDRRETEYQKPEGRGTERQEPEGRTARRDRQQESERPEPTRSERTRTVPGVEPGDGVPAARDSLVRTLVRFSERAETTDDPQRAREYLAAAREAAETLAALRR